MRSATAQINSPTPLQWAVINPIDQFLSQVGGITLFMINILKTFFTTRGNLQPILEQMVSVCMRSMATVAFAGVFVGAILVLQFNQMLVKFDAQVLLGGLNTSAVVREIGPLIISFLLAGKIGAYTTAELATMRVTDQIDAIECLGTNPVQYLIVPRFIAIVFSSMILLTIGLVISIGGSIWVADVFCGINPLQYASSIPKFTSSFTLISSFIKCLAYGLIVASVCCYQGFTAKGGARGVGLAVTQAALYTNFYIILAQFLINNILEGFN